MFHRLLITAFSTNLNLLVVQVRCSKKDASRISVTSFLIITYYLTDVNIPTLQLKASFIGKRMCRSVLKHIECPHIFDFLQYSESSCFSRLMFTCVTVTVTVCELFFFTLRSLLKAQPVSCNDLLLHSTSTFGKSGNWKCQTKRWTVQECGIKTFVPNVSRPPSTRVKPIRGTRGAGFPLLLPDTFTEPHK